MTDIRTANVEELASQLEWEDHAHQALLLAGRMTGDRPGFDGSWSILFSVIDLGAIATKRFDDATQKTIGEIVLGDIFAPGLNGLIDFPGVPLSFGIGAQLGPDLWADNGGASLPSARLHAFIAVDMPLFNLHVTSQ